MITNKEDLKFYLEQDFSNQGGKRPTIKDLILKNEKWYIYQYKISLRHVEYYSNKSHKGLRFLYWWIRYKRLGFKLKYIIPPNTIGPGLAIYHTGDLIHVKKNTKIGKNCILRPGVVFGQKHRGEKDIPVTVGNNVEFGLGVRIFGNVEIGNDVCIGANAVVTKNIPENSVAVGIPAKVIKNFTQTSNANYEIEK